MADTPKKTDVLVYTGGANVREITKAQWDVEGIDQDTVRWFTYPRDGANAVKVGDLKKEALDLLLERHGDEFRVESPNATDAKTPAPNGE